MLGIWYTGERAAMHGHRGTNSALGFPSVVWGRPASVFSLFLLVSLSFKVGFQPSWNQISNDERTLDQIRLRSLRRTCSEKVIRYVCVRLPLKCSECAPHLKKIYLHFNYLYDKTTAVLNERLYMTMSICPVLHHCWHILKNHDGGCFQIMFRYSWSPEDESQWFWWFSYFSCSTTSGPGLI